jgi:uncharacterized membrane protein
VSHRRRDPTSTLTAVDSDGSRLAEVDTVSPRSAATPRSSHRLAYAIDGLCILVTAALLGTMTAGVHGLARLLLALIFSTYVPGWAVVANIAALRRTSIAALPVLVSLAATTFAATFTLWIGHWAPIRLFWIEAALSVVAIVVATARQSRGRHAVNPSDLTV